MTQAIRPIRSKADHAAALKEAELLVGAVAGTAEGDRLAVLGILIADYERRTFNIEPVAPLAIVVLDMEMHGRTQTELARVLGSRSRASELLAGHRTLTPAMADRLADAWKIPRDLLGPRGASARPGRRLRLAGVAVLAAALSGFAGGQYMSATHDLPSLAPLLATSNMSGFLPLDEVPLHVRQAFIAAEDSNFYTHDGTDLRGVARASLDSMINIAQGRRPSGGGSITNQLVKGTLLAGETRSLRRRLREMVLSARLEKRLSKDRVFELYLNSLYLGADVRGLKAASIRYFGCAPNALTVSQAAMLAALPSAPNALRIDRAENLARAHARRDWVLSRMGEEGYLTAASLDQASAAPLR